MPLPSAQPTPRTALTVLIAALAVAGSSGSASTLGLAYPAVLQGPAQVGVGVHRPYRPPPGAPAVPRPVEDLPQDWIDQPEGRALTRQMQGLITAQQRRQRVCLAVALPEDAAATDLCGSTAAGGPEDRLLKAARGDHQAVHELARHCNAPGGSSPAGPSGFASPPGGLAGQGLWARVGGDLALYRLAAASYLLLPHTPEARDGQKIVSTGAGGLPADDKLLMALRQARPSLAHGSCERAVALGATLSVQRRLGAELTVLTYNYGPAPARLQLPGLPAGARLEALHPRSAAAQLADAQGRASVALAAQSFAVWQVVGSGLR